MKAASARTSVAPGLPQEPLGVETFECENGYAHEGHRQVGSRSYGGTHAQQRRKPAYREREHHWVP